MKTIHSNHDLIAGVYEDMHEEIRRYIAIRIKDDDEAKDLCQDVFLRLFDYDILAKETIRRFVYTIARNIVIDHLRHHAMKQTYTSYIYARASRTFTHPTNQIIADDLGRHEQLHVAHLPEQRRKVYVMTRYEDKTSAEIAQIMNLEIRTVENHLFLARKEVRKMMAACK